MSNVLNLITQVTFSKSTPKSQILITNTLPKENHRRKVCYKTKRNRKIKVFQSGMKC